MSFPLALLLIPYAIAVAIFVVVALLNAHHLIHYGAANRTSFLFTLAFLAGTAAIGFLTYQLLIDVDWQVPISVSLSSGGTEMLPY
ncbi:MAG: hypothetical protein ABIJ46_02905 [bacterium]